jgi:hypothetical protein
MGPQRARVIVTVSLVLALPIAACGADDSNAVSTDGGADTNATDATGDTNPSDDASLMADASPMADASGDAAIDATADSAPLDAAGDGRGWPDARPLDARAPDASWCVRDLQPCLLGDTCCSAYYVCRSGLCEHCLGTGEGCNIGSDCCSHSCNSGVCN